MNYSNTIDHQKSPDLTSEGVLLLIEDLLQTCLAVRVKVGGRSMHPFLKENDVVTIRKTAPLLLKNGDLVLFVNDGGSPILHRIIRIKKDNKKNIIVQTKGDGLIGLDTPVDASRVLGCVSRIEVKESTSDGKTTYSYKDLTLIRHRLIATAVAMHGLLKYYFYRIMVKYSLKRT